MSPSRPLLAAALALAFVATATLGADDPYVGVLRTHGIEPDRAALSTYLRRLAPNGEIERLADALIARLASDDYYEREEAEARLLSMPSVPLAKLETATRDPDYEVAWRARRIIARAKDGTRDQILNAAFRTIAQAPLEGLAPEILGILPAVGEPWIRDSARLALRATAGAGDADRLRTTAADEKAAGWVRAAALDALGETLGDAASDEIAAYLVDDDATVRLGAARTLARRLDRRAVGAYLALLESDDRDTRQRASDDLRAITGQNHGFSAYASAQERTKAVGAWRAWWRANPDAKLEPFDDRPAFLGRILLCRYSSNEVREYDLRGNLLWKKTGVTQPFAGKGTPAGHRLFSVFSENVILEFDASGREVWRSPKMPGFISGIQRLPNGNTLAALGHAGRIMEITPSGKTVWNVAVAGNPMEATRLANGRTLVALQGGGGVAAIEIDGTGRRLWALKAPPAYAAQRLEDGTTVLSHPGNGIAAYSRDGRKLWDVGGYGGLYRGQLLPDGNILIADSSGLKIVDRSRKVLRSIPDSGGTVYVSAH